MAITSHITPALPKQTRGVLPAERWAELHDFLTLALDALGERPEDFSRDFLLNAVMHQRLALKLTHKAMQALEMAVPTTPRQMDYLCETHQPRGRA